MFEFLTILSLLALALALAMFLPGRPKTLFGALALMLLPTLAFASVDPNELPGVIAQVIIFLASLKIGNFDVGMYVVLVIKWIGLVGGILSALSIFVTGVIISLTGLLKLPELVAIKAFSSAPAWAEKLTKVAETIKALNDKVQPWLKYLSVFNVQKK
jgi:hypothetical protein